MPLINLAFMIVMLDSNPVRLAQHAPHAPGTVSRDVTFSILDFTAFVTRWRQAPVGSDLLTPSKAGEVSHFCRIRRRGQSAGYNGIHFQPPMWTRHYVDPALKTGHFICYGHRTDHLLPTCADLALAHMPLANLYCSAVKSIICAHITEEEFV